MAEHNHPQLFLTPLLKSCGNVGGVRFAWKALLVLSALTLQHSCAAACDKVSLNEKFILHVHGRTLSGANNSTSVQIVQGLQGRLCGIHYPAGCYHDYSAISRSRCLSGHFYSPFTDDIFDFLSFSGLIPISHVQPCPNTSYEVSSWTACDELHPVSW